MRVGRTAPPGAALLGVLACAALLAGCRGSEPPAAATAPPGATGTPTATASTTAATPPAPATPPTATPPISVEPRPVALAPLPGRTWTRPVELGAYPLAGGGGAALFVAEQEGTVYAVEGDSAALILDLRDRVSRAGDEEGLLSVALDPAFASNRFVWLYYSAANPRRSVLARFTRDANDHAIDPASALVVLEIAQPYANHNGGAIRFGPDGMLYLGIGDGGSAGDPQGNGQNLGTLLGKVIRIDVRDASTARPYTVPPDNPFVGRAGARAEIWAYGLRNPWRMAFDAATGALWAGDVGQGAVEEVDVVQRGGNYGWSIVEGDRCYRPAQGCNRDGLTPPLASYDHGGGRCSITGGVVYRGRRVPEIAGAYLYADFCSGDVWAIRADAPAAPATPVRIASGVANLAAFGVDGAGEVYLLAFGQPLRQIVSP